MKQKNFPFGVLEIMYLRTNYVEMTSFTKKKELGKEFWEYKITLISGKSINLVFFDGNKITEAERLMSSDYNTVVIILSNAPENQVIEDYITIDLNLVNEAKANLYTEE
jgi:hypothetical protein